MKITALDAAALNALLNANSAAQTAIDPNFIKTLSPKEAEDVQRAAKLLIRAKESVWQRMTGATEVAPTEELKDAIDGAIGKRHNRPEMMLEIKKANEHRPIGVTMACPVCNTNVKKARYNTNFCSNKGAGNCKDAFYQATQGDRHKKG